MIKMEKICQCCGMPISRVSQRGTEKDGNKSGEYCCFCYKVGKFTFNGSYDEFIERQVTIAQKMLGLPEDKARVMANDTLPKLKRWKT